MNKKLVSRVHVFTVPHRKWTGAECSICGKTRGHINHAHDPRATAYQDETHAFRPDPRMPKVCNLCGFGKEHPNHVMPITPEEAKGMERAMAAPRDLTNLPVSEWTDEEVRGYAAFTIESVAHLRGMEELLPVAERLRAMK